MGIFDKFKDAGEGISEAFTGAGKGISNVINSAKGQIPPELEGEILKIEATAKAELEKLRANSEYQFANLAAEAQRELMGFTLQYEGTASQVPKWVLVLRSVIRPMITILMFASFLFFLFSDIFNAGTSEYQLWLIRLPVAYWVLLNIVVGFWFGGKIGENITDKLQGTSPY